MPQVFTVLGAGSWGTTFAKVLADAGRDVQLWARRPQLAEQLRLERMNHTYLPGVQLPETIVMTSDLDAALVGPEVVVLAVPSQSLRENIVVFAELIPPKATVLSLAKGFEIGTGLAPSQIIEHVGHIDPDRIAVLSGPNIAKEIAAEQPSATLLAGRELARVQALQRACAGRYFRPVVSTDVLGAEIAGTAKNVIALACGIAQGLGLGANVTGSLITAGLAEIRALIVALGGQPDTATGLAGLGDLVATCLSPASRNRTMGQRIGQGLSLEQAALSTNGQVAEGVASCRSVRDLAHRHQIPVPVCEAVYRVCYEHLPATGLLDQLVGWNP